MSEPYPSAGSMRRVVRSTDGTREYVIHLPPRGGGSAAASATPMPLLVLLHGSGSSGHSFEKEAGMDSVADRHGLVVAYPDGVRRVLTRSPSDWNAGACCGLAQQHNVDDVGFLRALIADVSRNVAIDRSRVYVAGFSDGGRMAYRAGCELSDVVAAVAVVSGSLELPGCRPARAVPLLAIHGTVDPEVAIDEPVPGDSVMLAATHPLARLVSPSVRRWGMLTGCTGRGSAVLPGDTRVTVHTLTGCGNAEVVFLQVAGLAHGWPAPDPAATPGSATEHQLSASHAIVEFLLRQRR